MQITADFHEEGREKSTGELHKQILLLKKIKIKQTKTPFQLSRAPHIRQVFKSLFHSPLPTAPPGPTLCLQVPSILPLTLETLASCLGLVTQDLYPVLPTKHTDCFPSS